MSVNSSRHGGNGSAEGLGRDVSGLGERVRGSSAEQHHDVTAAVQAPLPVRVDGEREGFEARLGFVTATERLEADDAERPPLGPASTIATQFRRDTPSPMPVIIGGALSRVDEVSHRSAIGGLPIVDAWFLSHWMSGLRSVLLGFLLSTTQRS